MIAYATIVTHDKRFTDSEEKAKEFMLKLISEVWKTKYNGDNEIFMKIQIMLLFEIYWLFFEECTTTKNSQNEESWISFLKTIDI